MCDVPMNDGSILLESACVGMILNVAAFTLTGAYSLLPQDRIRCLAKNPQPGWEILSGDVYTPTKNFPFQWECIPTKNLPFQV